jgi:hypothetical protein
MLKDLATQIFGRLTVKTRLPNDKYRRAVWLCDCSCGKQHIATSQVLLSGNTQSCGCLVADTAKKVNTTHGATANGQKTPEYQAYINAKRRCIDPNTQAYARYGGRGIQFLLTSFEEFLAEVGPRPTPRHSLDRRNNDGHYITGNLKWSTKKEQANNRRPPQCLRCQELEKLILQLGGLVPEKISTNSNADRKP